MNGWWASLVIAASDIKLAHSVFALPFAVLGAFLARPAGSTWRRFAGQLALVVVCMVFARTWAMLVNRLADRAFDAANARTARRVFAAGRLTARRGWLIASLAAAFFVAAAALFFPLFANPWPGLLAIPVLGWIALYSYTKRFTALCHLFLGGALAASPLAAALAVHPPAITSTPSVWAIAGFVLLWVAGFDVIYALQDRDFDRSTGLSSVPAAIGSRGAVWLSRAFHAGACALLLMAWRAEPRFSALTAAAIACVAALLIVEHGIVARSRIAFPPVFFTLNGCVSCLLGLAGCLDILELFRTNV